jgi:hypothetical protein
MKYLNDTLSAFREVYSSKNYFFVTFMTAFILFSLNGLIRNYDILINYFSFSLLVHDLWGKGVSPTISGLVSLITISLLAGVAITFSVFLVKRQVAGGLSGGAPGTLIALLAPSCPACAISFLGFVGLSGLIGFLPFKGRELGPVAIVLILLSIMYLSRKIVTKVCSIKLPKKE